MSYKVLQENNNLAEGQDIHRVTKRRCLVEIKIKITTTPLDEMDT